MIVFATNFRLIISVFCGALMERYTCGSQKPMPQGLRVRISRALPCRLFCRLTYDIKVNVVDTLDKNFVASSEQETKKFIVFGSSFYRPKTIKGLENEDELYFMKCV